MNNFVVHEAVITRRWFDFYIVFHIDWEVKWVSFPFKLKVRIILLKIGIVILQ